MEIKNIPLGQLLIESNSISAEQLEEALIYKKNHNELRIGEILEKLGFISEEEKLQALSDRLNIPIYKKDKIEPLIEIAQLVPENLAKLYKVMPIEIIDNQLIVAINDPLNYFGLEEIKAACGLPIITVLASNSAIQAAISTVYSANNMQDALIAMQEEFGLYDADLGNVSDNAGRKTLNTLNDIIDSVDNTPLVRFIDNLIRQAYELGASDVHIEPFAHDIIVRIRIDGILKDYRHINIVLKQPLITRFKIMGGMNIAESRIPQDGRIDVYIDEKQLDIRISTIPTIYGEKVVIRLLGNSTNDLNGINQIGLNDKTKEMLLNLIKKQYGIILITGPTGSGKTTTLYSLLNEVNVEAVNIVTVEDPVEKRIYGINQVQVNPKANLTFASGLRSILRQDPDIIMVGEIRDEETAEIATRSAITGHLVLSTIHTNDTATAIARLENMGIPAYLISASVIGIIAQRLVRKVCINCREPYTTSTNDTKLLNGHRGIIYKAIGCDKCNNMGYKGRIPLFEVMKIDSEIRDHIAAQDSIENIRRLSINKGMGTLQDYMIELVINGESTLDEYLRIVAND